MTFSTTNFIRPTLALRKMIGGFFSFDLTQITFLTRSETQQSKEITLMDNPFSSPKIIQNNMLPQVKAEKEKAAT